ncbi:MAG: dTDP-4-dehydrorhamnose 3,5-epimerase family protein [Candidatus Aminicenantes bacterium]|nr:dTDP-4-dehydrorhamnose 3,5-epimerase family protein [Candidatus Aminicenantes bacterium]
MIEGVIIQKLNQIVDERGKVMHMLRCDSPLFTKFGEVYFSIVNPGVVKAWKRHQKMTQNITVPVGKIRLVFYDDRKNSLSYGKVEISEIGEDNYCLVKIPPHVCYGFKGISLVPALIANCTNLPHDPDEVINIDASDKKIPYDWNQ